MILLFWVRVRDRRAVARGRTTRSARSCSLNSPPRPTEHWFGTDQLGRDVFARVIVGARNILTIAPLATFMGTVAGTAVGLVMGYFDGWVDT